MAREILTPFQLNVAGGIAETDNPDTMVRQHVESLVATEPGERVMQPDYGIPLKEMVFEADLTAVQNMLYNDTVKAFSFWEPNVVVMGVIPKTPEDFDGVASIEVDYARGIQDNTERDTATVFVGGRVQTVTEITQ